MTTSELLQSIAGIHNTIAQIKVSGDDAILMAQALGATRTLVQHLHRTLQAEEGTPEEAEHDRT